MHDTGSNPQTGKQTKYSDPNLLPLVVLFSLSDMTHTHARTHARTHTKNLWRCRLLPKTKQKSEEKKKEKIVGFFVFVFFLFIKKAKTPQMLVSCGLHSCYENGRTVREYEKGKKNKSGYLGGKNNNAILRFILLVLMRDLQLQEIKIYIMQPFRSFCLFAKR